MLRSFSIRYRYELSLELAALQDKLAEEKAEFVSAFMKEKVLPALLGAEAAVSELNPEELARQYDDVDLT